MTDRQKIFIEVFRKNAGNISVTCRKLNNMKRDIYYRWYNEPAKIEANEEGIEVIIENEFKASADEVKESLIDFTESALYKKISGITTKTTKIKEVLNKDGKKVRLKEEQTITHAPDIAAIIFLLKTLGRKRGWRDTLDIDLKETQGNEITQDIREAIKKLSPEEKKMAIAIGKKLND